MKGHYDTLRAIPLLLRHHPATRFLFAGDEERPGERARLIALAHDAGIEAHLQFLGPVDFAHKVELLRTCTVLILPSHAENMPMSLLEGMAVGVPVVATRVGAVPEVLGDGEWGAVIAPGDHEALAAAIGTYLADPPAAEAIGRRAQERARQSWNVDKVAAALHALYVELTTSAAPG
jgi:glycosyltransferase involved in cell wall biosynthesis